MKSCPAFDAGGSGGVAEALRAVDCQSGAAVESAFSRLFGAEGMLGHALGLALTLYVGFLAVSVLTGRSSLSLSALTPRMLAVGLALTFATSWAAYQTVVWNLLSGAPDEIAGLLIGARGSATELFAGRLDQIFNAVAEAADAAQKAAGAAVAPTSGPSLSSPVGLLNISALMLLLGTVGVLIVARIALAALLALGPVFILLSLFSGTRGLFEGWLKTAVLFAVVPLIAVLVGGATLSMLTPLAAELSRAGPDIPPRLAVTVFLGAFVHLALSVLAFKAAASLTAGWRLPFNAEVARPESAEHAAATVPSPAPAIAAASYAPAAAGDGRIDHVRSLAAGTPPPASGPSGADAAARDRVIPFPGVRNDTPAGPVPTAARDGRSEGLARRFRTNPAHSLAAPRPREARS